MLHPDTDAAVLVEAVEQVSLSAGEEAKEGGGITLHRDATHGLLELQVHYDHLSRCHNEEVVAVGGGEGDLEIVR